MAVKHQSSERISKTPETIADILLRERRISAEVYEQAMREHHASERPVSRVLVDLGAISEKDKLVFLQRETKCDVVSLKDVSPRADVAGFMTKEKCRRIRAVPLRVESGRLLVAMEDPTDVRAMDALETAMSLPVRPVLATGADIDLAINRMPEGVEAPQTRSGSGIASKISLLLLVFGPVAIFYYFLFAVVPEHDALNDWVNSINMDMFERTLFIVLGWLMWASVAYFLHDLVFGEKKKSG